jgi:hypothetical protein
VVTVIDVRAHTEDGISVFLTWLDNPKGDLPKELIAGDLATVPYGNWRIDPDRQFVSRLSLGKYLKDALGDGDANRLLEPSSDGLWSWLAAIWLRQLAAKKIRRAEHYVVMRKGPTGSLAYRHGVRTSFELVHIHGDDASICLNTPMSTWGDMAEQLASRQTIAHNRGFFKIAAALYLSDGKLKRGAASKPKNPKDRMPGDRAGLGSARRLALALQRLDLTYDTEIMKASQIAKVLPKEFARWMENTRSSMNRSVSSHEAVSLA